MSEDITTGSAESAARSAMYRFFSNVFLCPPNGELTSKLTDLLHMDELGSLFGSETIKELRRFTAHWEPDQLSALRQEYFDLFVVPTKRYVAPFEDVYREHTPGTSLDKGPLMGRHAISVLETYRRAGAAMVNDCKELPTHAGVEFSFMSFLCDKEAEAWQVPPVIVDGGDEPKTDQRANEYRQHQRAFLQQHLAVWLPQLRHAVETNALTPYFSCMTDMSAQYVALDLAGLSTSNDMLETETPEMIHG